MWTDVNKKTLIDTLALHSSSRYSNLSNAKGKWKLIVIEFEKATGLLAVKISCANLYSNAILISQDWHTYDFASI